ncbi:MAG TPA: flagellar hook-length control protein FliK [Gammaproteobacteria bacterium]|nr:flagellar hook-length control protein FliK [Gammaproteobacteria bacterium]
MITGNLTALANLDGGAASPKGGGDAAGGGFLEKVANGVQELTGKPVTADDVTNWLEGHPPASFPSGDELAGLLKEMLPGGDGDLKALLKHNHTDDANVNVAALIGAMAAASAGQSVGGSAGKAAASNLLGQLRGDDSQGVRQLLDDLRGTANEAGKGKSDGNAVFHQLIQAAQNGGGDAGKSAAAARAHVPTLQVDQPVGQPGFGQQMGDRIAWMVKNDVQQARVHVNPPGLGPVELSVHMAHDKTSVSMAAHHAVTRDALAADAPRLQAMLEESGFAQVNVDVSQRESRGDEAFEGADGQRRGGAPGVNGIEGVEGDRESLATPAPRVGRSLVDHYA